MHLHCTQKLLKELAFKDQLAIPPSNRLSGWHAHLVSIARSKTIIAVNDQNLFAVLMPDINKKRLQNFSNEFRQALSAVLKSEEFRALHAELLLGDGFLFAKAHDRKVLGIINQIVKDIRYRIEHAGGWKFINILELTKLINRTPWLASSKNPVFPTEEMTHDLKSLLH